VAPLVQPVPATGRPPVPPSVRNSAPTVNPAPEAKVSKHLTAEPAALTPAQSAPKAAAPGDSARDSLPHQPERT
jgi:hypothetical protein